MTNNRSPAFTLIELLVVIAIIGIMVAIAVPVFNGVLERAKVTKGLSNLRQIGMATQLYMSTPGGTATGGTHSSRTKINALFADWHVETMLWSGTGPAFTNTTATGTDPDGAFRWSP